MSSMSKCQESHPRDDYHVFISLSIDSPERMSTIYLQLMHNIMAQELLKHSYRDYSNKFHKMCCSHFFVGLLIFYHIKIP